MLSIVVLVIYLSGCLWLLAAGWRASSPQVHPSQLLTGLSVAGLGALLHAYLLSQSIFRGTHMAMNTTEVASLVGWLLVLITIWTNWHRPRFALIGAPLLLAAGILAVLTDDGSRNFVISQSGWELITHVIVAIVAYSLITVGAVFALALSTLDARLRKHQRLGVVLHLPSVEALEKAMFQTISVGFVLLTLTLLSGFVFVQDLLSQHLAHKVVLSCIAWLILAILLVGRRYLGWRGRTAARWVVGGFVVLLLAYFGSKFVLEVVLQRHWG